MKIVTIGGGSGQHALLSGLMLYSLKNPELKQENISAIVSTFDTGGHTGRLIEARIPKDVKGNFLPVGDIRQCLAGMANNDDAKKWFQYRLKQGDNMGAVVGNILLDAGYEQHDDDFEKSIDLVRKILDVKANVYPCTLKRATFGGVLTNGYKITGEEELVEKSVWFNSLIKKVFIEPEDVEANHNAIEAILHADKIVLSQGSLYTSLIPNLLVKELVEAIRQCDAEIIYVMNIVTQRGETDNFTAKDHLTVLEEYLGKNVIDKIIIHEGEVPGEMIEKYEQEGQKQVVDDLGNDKRAVRVDLLNKNSPVLRHDPEKLVDVILGS